MTIGASILIVDDEKNTRSGLEQFLKASDYDVFQAESAREAIETFKKERPDVVLTDLRMPDMDGIDLLHEIKRQKPEIPVIMLTAYGTVENAVQAMKAGAFYYLTKPINFDELELVLKKAFAQNALEQENSSLREELMRERHESGEIIGDSDEIRKLIDLTKTIAKSDSQVLIQGESGTGKELFAHLIHKESHRSMNPFVAVHMAALTETLLASELFGHERGAFTGATERKIGRFERANNGTLFLDEVSEIPGSMQTKLLRVLQSGEFERVGGTKMLRTNVRLVCATNKNLKEEVAGGRFRDDLFYRINVILLEIPPLRKRTKDIPLLANHFLTFFSERNRKHIDKVAPEVMERLCRYHWPGNIRELKNIIERMVVLAPSNTISIEQVPDDIRSISSSVRPDQNITTETNGGSPATLQKMEEEMIRKALLELNHNKTLAAKKLGISRRTLYRKLAEYHIVE